MPHGANVLCHVPRKLNEPLSADWAPECSLVFSTNGHLFVEFEGTTGITSKPRPLAEFPAPAELRARYEASAGFSLEDAAAAPLLAPYPGGEATRRYYQDAAIRAVFEKIARCARTGEPKRALLSLATGSGKTFIAVQILRRIADAGQLQRALFVCDRDELRSQASGALQNAFGSDAAEVYKDSDGKNHARNARIHIATYQTLDVDTEEGTANFLTTEYPENYVSHIVIDECHRSAWGKGSQVLTLNPSAVQIGLTATPRHDVGARHGVPVHFSRIMPVHFSHGMPHGMTAPTPGMRIRYMIACYLILSTEINFQPYHHDSSAQSAPHEGSRLLGAGFLRGTGPPARRQAA